MNNIKILDCTLRDGGYYNNWKFDDFQVKKYLKDTFEANIDVIEVGFHFLHQNPDYGKYAYINNDFLNTLKIRKGKKIAIMFNGSDFLRKDCKPINILKDLFKYNNHTSVVRVAIHHKDLKKMKKFLDFFKKKKLTVCLNLMQINTIKKNKLIDCLNILKRWDNVDIFYFADSFGNLKPADIKKICRIIKKHWVKDFGIHAHDNCGLALKNAIRAYKCGATWIDGTIQGMGRGAGNAKTEELLSYFSKQNYYPEKIKNISRKYFGHLKKQYNWGPSKLYKYAAKFNIHPTYVQLVLQDKRYSNFEQNSLIKYLAKIDSKTFDPNFLTSINLSSSKQNKWNAKNWCLNRNILLLGQGKSLKSQNIKNLIKKFIVINKPIVVSLNINNFVSKELIDYYASCHGGRILVDHKNYFGLKKKFILPLDLLKSFKEIKKIITF